MKQKNRGLPRQTGETPLLPPPFEREQIEFSFRQRSRMRLGYRLYLLTAALVVILAFAVLLMGFDGNRLRQVWLSLSQDEPNDSQGGDSDQEGLNGGEDGSSSDTDESGENTTDSQTPPSPSLPSAPSKDLYDFDFSAVPRGEIPILPMDLSLLEYGDTYIQNLTGYAPNAEALLRRPLSQKIELPEYLSLQGKSSPSVLIVHTHASEAYSEDGAISYAEGEETARSNDPEENVIAVGEALADELNRRGISTVHCRVMHDTQYKGAYERAKETIERYLEQYPDICLVIDLHRDAIFKSSGEMVRPVTLLDGEAAAQVLCVVGSDFGGESNPNWEGNLALALQLRKKLNDRYTNLCRPPYLKAATYNQELSPYSLLLEVGACGNSVEEAKRSAAAVGGALAEILGEMK